MIIFAATPSPSPSMPADMTSATVTPGLPGFFIFFFMAVLLVLLMIDMSRRIRRTSARATVEERMRAREAKMEQPEDERPAKADGADDNPGA